MLLTKNLQARTYWCHAASPGLLADFLASLGMYWLLVRTLSPQSSQRWSCHYAAASSMQLALVSSLTH
eukprot:2906805-Amphidinium_carterae.2